MPQTFQVLKCFKCSIFQVHLSKKSNKWECKLCGEKQSIKRHYGIGSALDCRGHVQKLNAIQGNKNETLTQLKDLDSEDDIEYIQKETKVNNSKTKSKWSAFIDENDDSSDADQQKHLDLDLPLQVSKKQKYGLCKTESYEENSIRPNIKSKEKKHMIQESRISSNKWSAFDDEIQISSKTVSVQVPKTLQCEVYDWNCNIDESANLISSSCNKSNMKKYSIQDNIMKSNKWSVYVSEEENTNENWLKTSRRHLDDKKKNMHENRDASPNKFLENLKETTVSQNFESQDTHDNKNAIIYHNKENNLRVKNKSITFSLCDDNDLDSILDF